MPLNKPRLKAAIILAFKAEQLEEGDYEASLDRIAEKLADCIIDEIKELKINYTNGLVANVPVTGTINASIT